MQENRTNCINFIQSFSYPQQLQQVMLNYKSSVLSSAKFNDSDMGTAVKTSYQQYSPNSKNVGTPSLNPQNRYTQEFEKCRSTINSIIDEIDFKKSINNQAVRRVGDANADAAGMLRQVQTQYQGVGYGGEPLVQVRGPSRPAQYGYEDRRGRQNGELILQREDSHVDLSPIQPNQNDLERENMELRRALNLQVKQNRELIERVRFLENENEDLRGQLGLPIPKRLAQTHYTQNVDRPASSYLGAPSPSPSRPQTRQGRRAQWAGDQNTNLNQRQQNQFRDLRAGLRNLKAEDEYLRHQTISVLRKHDY